MPGATLTLVDGAGREAGRAGGGPGGGLRRLDTTGTGDHLLVSGAVGHSPAAARLVVRPDRTATEDVVLASPVRTP